MSLDYEPGNLSVSVVGLLIAMIMRPRSILASFEILWSGAKENAFVASRPLISKLTASFLFLTYILGLH